MAVQGVVNSNEIAGADALPLCFSLPAQMTLGLVKCMRSGRVYVPDCEGELQLFEVKGSRLRAVCINEFATADELERPRTVGVKTENSSPEYTQTLRLEHRSHAKRRFGDGRRWSARRKVG